MTDRRRRAALLLPLPATAPGVVLLPRERKSSSSSPEPDAPDSPDSDRDNPFAPPPPDAPDQEWRPRHRAHTPGQGNNGEEEPPQDEQTPSWGSQWSPRQPGRQSGGFGSRPGGRNGQQNGGPGGSGNPGGLRWDPTDPSQRRARYALLAGLWSFFCVLFSLPEVALLLGVLAIYWGISSLRAKPNPAKASAAATTAAMEGRPAPTTQPAPESQPGAPASPGTGTRPQVTSAIAGLVIASLALMMVAATFTVQIVYRDYFTCVNDALTQSSGKSCEKLLPKELRPLLGTQQ
ncbi:hypothetical protein WKI65_18775 [Streptomyces sp. MS1.AVA.3]|uniref:hypothetical protein n=1 Tax=Streptomyces decoyicus TaxID=249567 RepID=UPI0030BEDF6A